MKTLLLCSIIIISFLLASCSKDSSPLSSSPISSISGNIANWNLGTGKFLSMGFSIQTGPDGPDPIAWGGFAKTSVDAAGNFSFLNVPQPPDSFYYAYEHRDIYMNQGFIYDSLAPFMHEYAVYFIPNRYQDD